MVMLNATGGGDGCGGGDCAYVVGGGDVDEDVCWLMDDG